MPNRPNAVSRLGPLGRTWAPALAEPANGRLGVAAFGQGLLAVHHRQSGSFPEGLDGSRSDLSHTGIS